MTFRVISLNTRGIAEKVKRRAIFNYYRQRTDILCLQETHSTPEDELIWTNEWGGRVLFSHGTSSSRGVAVLFSRNIFFNINNIVKDINGRYIICDINQDSTQKTITLCVLYGPNKDTPVFFDTLESILMERCENKLMIGDLNLVLDTKLDRKESENNNKHACEKLKQIMDVYYLTDVWRDRNPGVRRYTWRNKNHASRIDNMLISQGLDNMVKNCTYLQGILTDHSAAYIAIQCNNNERGTGYWKMNTRLLDRQDCIDEIRKCLQTTDTSNKTLDPMEKWLKVKKAVTEKIQSISRNLATEEKLIIAQLSEAVDTLESSMPLDMKHTEIYERTKTDLNNLVLKRAEGLRYIHKSTVSGECDYRRKRSL